MYVQDETIEALWINLCQAQDGATALAKALAAQDAKIEAYSALYDAALERNYKQQQDNEQAVMLFGFMDMVKLD